MADETTSIVIMGATGDLAQRKLLPALFQLCCKGRLPPSVRVVGYSRSEYSDDEFRELTWQRAQEFGELAVQRDVWDSFAQSIFYVSGDLNDTNGIERLKKRLEDLERGDQANRLFYLSIAPQLYEPAIQGLGATGLSRQEVGWHRMVIEKPFGRDLESARALNKIVHQNFDESQVYRIDHYLGKETVQNLMVFRFANAIFEPIWNRNFVDNVQITVSEKVDVGDRAGYYDQSGVVRDMVQNHLLQLLTMVAMEPPSSMDSESLRNKKVDVLKAIRRWEPEDTPQHAIRGQYMGYLNEKGVPDGSKTGTYAALRLYLDNWRWQGVPFYLRSGKSMEQKVSEIVIHFRRPPHIMFDEGQGERITANALGICLQPDEGVHLKFEVKVPDQEMNTRSMDMEFHYDSAFKDQSIPEAYERLLQDALNGDPSLFIRSDHIEEAWRIVDPILGNWEDPSSSTPLYTYEPGSWGPGAADALLASDGRVWLQECAEHA